MILNQQRVFLVSATVSAFFVGALTGAVLTFGPDDDAAVMTVAVHAGGKAVALSQNSTAALTAEVDTGQQVIIESGYVQIEPGHTRKNTATAVSGQQSAQQEAGMHAGLTATASEQLQASIQANKTFPGALPEKPAITPPDPALTNSAEVADISRIAKAALEPRPWDTQAITVRPGDSMTTILKRAGVDGRQIHAALRSLRGVYDPRNLRAGQELAVTAAARNQAPADLLSVALDLNFDHQLLITRGADGDFTAKTVEQAKHRELVHREGAINASLYLSARRNAIPNSVTDHLIRMFSWDVDFQRDIHPGDRFETLYEKVTLARDEKQVKGNLVYAGLKVRGKLLDAYLYSPDGGRANYYGSEGQSLRKFLLRTPVDGARLSSHFGKRKHPVLGFTRMHKGTDFAAPRGTPIYAGGSGKIEVAGMKGTFGNYIRIRHSDTWSTAYAHLHNFAKGIKPGARVRQGQVIGYIGSTGRSTGPHLHYEVLQNGTQVNPMKMKQPPATQLSGAELAAFKKEVARIDALRTKLAQDQRLASRSVDSKTSD